MNGKLRAALPADFGSILEIDGSKSSEKESLLRAAIDAGHCHVFDDGAVQGFIILDNSFFNQGFISLCVVKKSRRSRGIGTQLFKYAESICPRKKLFSSTNMSNSGMRKLFLQLGYVESGIIDNLDEGDPEVFYFKPVG